MAQNMVKENSAHWEHSEWRLNSEVIYLYHVTIPLRCERQTPQSAEIMIKV